MLHRLFRLLAMVWIGSQLTIGYLVAPTLFEMLAQHSAGQLASRLFFYEAWLSVAISLTLLMLSHWLMQRSELAYRSLRWLLWAMLFCTLIGYFALAPFMETIRSAAARQGVEIEHSVYAARFAWLHGIAGGLYLLQSCLGVLLIWRLPFVARLIGKGL
jgi:uncharacterized membrane protein